MTRGRVLPVNSRVRRRLFHDDGELFLINKWSSDPLSKINKTEYIARTLNDELILKGMKWNFDFNSEMPRNGRMQWYRKGNSNEWVVMEPSGRTIQMSKRSRDKAMEFTYEGERSKVRRLSPQIVAQRRDFFIDGRVYNMALGQAKEENVLNYFNENPPPGTFTEDESLGYSSSEDETIEELKLKEEDEDSNNIEVKSGVETNDAGLVDTGDQATCADIIEMKKDANDNQEPMISEDNFEKLHIEDKDSTDINEQEEEKQKDMKNMNETTPKHEKNKAIAEETTDVSKLRAKKKLDNSRY